MRILIDAIRTKTLGKKGVKRTTCSPMMTGKSIKCAFELDFSRDQKQVMVYLRHDTNCFQESAHMLVATDEIVTVFKFTTGVD